MGEAKRRGTLADRIAQAATRPRPEVRHDAQRRVIRVRPCLMQYVRRCAVNFRVIDSQPPQFMCAEHWARVPEPVREALREAAARRPQTDPAVRKSWERAAHAAVMAVLTPPASTLPKKIDPVEV
jgi:hypothetical protein